MNSNEFLNWSIALLQGIEASDEKRRKCENYSVYKPCGEEQLYRDLGTLSDNAYRLGLVISNYRGVIAAWELDEQYIMRSDSAWLDDLPYLCILACIAYHFRQDHFCEGSLISESVASGAMLRLFSRLSALHHGDNFPTTLETLYRYRCESIPKEPGIYRVIAPQGMPIGFEETAANHCAPLYSAKELTEKYLSCSDKDILYIGKAGSRSGLRQRLWQYMKYGWNEATNHKGGRAIWQIRNAGMLLLEYECCEECKRREHELLREFKEKNGQYPVANRIG